MREELKGTDADLCPWIAVSDKITPWMLVRKTGMEKHPRTIDGGSGPAQELVAGKVSWQEGDSCKRGESTALKCQALHYGSGEEGGFIAAGISRGK